MHRTKNPRRHKFFFPDTLRPHHVEQRTNLVSARPQSLLRNLGKLAADKPRTTAASLRPLRAVTVASASEPRARANRYRSNPAGTNGTSTASIKFSSASDARNAA